MNIKEEIRRFIVDAFLFGDDGELSDGASLLGTGLIDSNGIMELVVFLESTFGITILDEELVPENLDTIDGIAALVGRKDSVGTCGCSRDDP